MAWPSVQSSPPGSVDASDNQIEQWNMRPPSLYLWSRPDWTPTHRAIAMKRGHALNDPEEGHLGAEDEPSVLEDRAAESKDGGALPDASADGGGLGPEDERKRGKKGPKPSDRKKSREKARKRSHRRKPYKQYEEPEERASGGPPSPPHQAGPEALQHCNPFPSGLGGHGRPFVDFGRPHGGLWGTSSVSSEEIESIRRRYEIPSRSSSQNRPSDIASSTSYERFSGHLRNNEQRPMHGHHEFVDLRRDSRNNNSPQAALGHPGSYSSHWYDNPGLPARVVSSGLPRRLGDGGMREMPWPRPPHLDEPGYLPGHYMPGTVRHRPGGESVQEMPEPRPAWHAEMAYFHGRLMAGGTQATLEPRQPPHAGPGPFPGRHMASSLPMQHDGRRPEVPELPPHYPRLRRWPSGGWLDE